MSAIYKVSSSVDLERILTKDISLLRFSRIHQLIELDTILGLLGKSMCILVLLSRFSILMDDTHIFVGQLRKDPVCGNLSTAYHKLEEHRS